MSFAIAGLVTGDQTIDNEMCVAKSFPDFWERFEVFYQ
jgi:5-enolpyruvylshikimate-3-phosphate synthase